MHAYNPPPLAVTLDRNEFAFLFSLLNDRIIEALDAGLSPSHESSIFRTQLQAKLMPFLRPERVVLTSCIQGKPSATVQYEHEGVLYEGVLYEGVLYPVEKL